jgi:hypothetical protein
LAFFVSMLAKMKRYSTPFNKKRDVINYHSIR